jgi:D-3-phosphoglycerate dehydrogenase
MLPPALIKGIVVAAAGSGTPHATAELTWGLISASLRHIPHEVEQLKKGVWQTTVGTGLKGRTLGVYAPGRIGTCVRSGRQSVWHESNVLGA